MDSRHAFENMSPTFLSPSTSSNLNPSPSGSGSGTFMNLLTSSELHSHSDSQQILHISCGSGTTNTRQNSGNLLGTASRKRLYAGDTTAVGDEVTENGEKITLGLLYRELKSLHQKVDALTANRGPTQTRAAGKSPKKKSTPSNTVRRAIRRAVMNSALQWDTAPTLKIKSPVNMPLTTYILQYVKSLYPEATDDVITIGMERYYKSVRQTAKLESSGQKDAARKASRRNMRKREKLERRLEALRQKTSWGPEDRKKYKTVLENLDFHSSEESDSHDSGVFLTRKRAWESTSLSSLKVKLDSKADKLASERSKKMRQLTNRKEGQPSTKQAPSVPAECSWALKL